MTNTRKASGKSPRRRRRFLKLESLESRQLLAVVAVDDSFAIAVNTTLVSQATSSTPVFNFGSSWKFLDDGSDQGTTWLEPGFNDSVWRSGPAEIGYGDGDEATTVGFGPDSANKYATTYFRGPVDARGNVGFNLPGASAVATLELTYVADDGVAFYLNGVEVVRSRLNPGTTFDQYALSDAPGDGKPATTVTINVTGLLNDTGNVLAAEVHQGDGPSSDISFDVQLSRPGLAPILRNDDLSNVAGNLGIAVVSPPVDSLSGAPAGSVQMGADGSFVYTPPTNYAGTAVFDYQLRDFDGLSTATITVRVDNAAPIAVDDGPYSVYQGQSFTTDAGLPPQGRILATGSVWKFLDDGSNQGTAWKERTFDDSSWRSGPAQLGYGDGDEATVLSFGPDGGNKFPTTYFRGTFELTDARRVSDLTMGLQRDDGAAVYINGTEVRRDNLIPDAPFDAYASSTSSGANETTFFESPVDPRVLINGTNVIAVEVHQANPTSSDISFDMYMDGVLGLPGLLDNDSDPEGDPLEVVEIASPPIGGSVSFNPDGSFTYRADSDFVGVDRFVYRIAQSNNPLNTATATVTINVLDVPALPTATDDYYEFPEDASILDVAATSFDDVLPPLDPTDPIDCQASGRLVCYGSNWLYLDDGSDQGDAWKETVFNDFLWRFSTAEFGYGEGDETTILDYGGNGNDRHITYYFRQYFGRPLDPVEEMHLLLNVDDGAVVYLNGTEIVRLRMPDGDVQFDTRALDEAPNLAASEVFPVDPALLTDINVLAVEVHQSSATNADLSFDAELLITSGLSVGVLANDFDADGDTVTVSRVNDNASAVGQTLLLDSGASLTLNADGTFSYRPAFGFRGEDTFEYTIDDGNGLTNTATVIINVGGQAGPPPPRIQGMTINSDQIDPPNLPAGPQHTNWERQRSTIATVIVTFDQNVFADASDFTLTNLGVNAPEDADVEVSLNPSQVKVAGNAVTLAFDNSPLPNGVFQLEVHPTITNFDGAPLDGDGDGVPGDGVIFVGSEENRFYQLTAEFNGDLGTSIFDFPAFIYWFGVPTPLAPSYMDMNKDGGVSIFDFPSFIGQFGVGVIFPAPPLAGILSADTQPDRPADEVDAMDAQIARRADLGQAEFRLPPPRQVRADEHGTGDREQPREEIELLELLARDVVRFPIR